MSGDETITDTDEVRYRPDMTPSLPPASVSSASTVAAAIGANLDMITTRVNGQVAAFNANNTDFADRVTTANGMYDATEEDNAARVKAAGPGLGDDDKRGKHGHGDGEATAVDYKTDKSPASDLPLYGPDGKAHPEDVIQGHVGDCYFEAAEIAVADKTPDKIQEKIRVGSDGNYYVSGMTSRNGVPLKDFVVSKDDVAKVLARHGSDQKVLWPIVLEAAAAKSELLRHGSDMDSPMPLDVNAGLDSMNSGGFPGTGLQQLTGASHYTALPGGAADEAKLMDAVNSGKPVILATSPSMTPLGIDPHRDGLVDGHSYAVSKVFRTPDGKLFADVYNPWGYNMQNGVSDLRAPAPFATAGEIQINLSDVFAHNGAEAFVVGGG